MSIDYNLHTFRSPKFQSVVNDAIEFLAVTPMYPLPPPTRFIGPGVYALYYTGDYESYTKIADLNRNSYTHPIYVGKAVPPGWRTGRGVVSETADIYRRLREHANSIKQATNLHIDDFHCRFVILSNGESDLVVSIEAELIRKYRPLWNTIVDGFGNHNPGKGRYNQAPSEWDVLHPGRVWVSRLTGIPPIAVSRSVAPASGAKIATGRDSGMDDGIRRTDYGYRLEAVVTKIQTFIESSFP